MCSRDPLIREIMNRSRGRARWLPHNKNPADALTKFKGAHAEPLIKLVTEGMFTLTPEKAELEFRAHQRQNGTNPRKKVGAVGAARSGNAEKARKDTGPKAPRKVTADPPGTSDQFFHALYVPEEVSGTVDTYHHPTETFRYWWDGPW